LPGGAIEVAREQLTRVASKGSQTLGLTFLIGLGVSLWSANAAMKSLFDTLNIVYGEEEKRGFVKLNAISLLFTVGGIVFVVVALGAIVVIPVALKYIGFPRRLICSCVSAGGRRCSDPYAGSGRHLPLRAEPRGAAVAVDHRGSAMAAMLWLGISALFSWYASSFGNFNETYGSGRGHRLHDLAVDFRDRHPAAPNSTPGWSIRPRATPRPAPQSPWGPGWPTRLERPRAGDAGPTVSKSGRAGHEARQDSGPETSGTDNV
jgi:hypothetical protein